MAISYNQVEVTCDGDKCDGESITFSDTSRESDPNRDAKIEAELESMGWIVRDGLHFCSEECAGYSDES